MPRSSSRRRSGLQQPSRESLRVLPTRSASGQKKTSTPQTRSFTGVDMVISRTRTRTDNDSMESKSSRPASTRSVSLASETPDTSVVVTPAEPRIKGRGRPRGRVAALASPAPSASTRSSSKRKRTSANEESVTSFDTSKDEELAIRLQADEYAESDDTSVKPSSSRRPATKKQSKTPTRSARKVAPQKSLTLGMLDTEDDDFLSDEVSNFSTAFAGDSESDRPIAMSRPAKRARLQADVGDNTASNSRANKTSRRALNDVVDDDDDEHDEDESDEDALDVSRLRLAFFDRRKARRRQKLERAHPEIKTMWAELEDVPIINPVQAPQPESITRELKSFQLEGLDWMVKQEKSHYKGGLLGDEMGMGKTIQAVSLIMSDFPAKAPSLVLVPPVALMQWHDEINSYTNGKLKVLVIHNTNSKAKNLTVKIIKQYNVLIMSYNSLESMYRKQEKGWNRGEDIVKADSPIHAVHWHRVILDEAHSIKTRVTGSAKACFALKGTYKWCLSGTPVQNRIGEFFSLLRFLEVRPFADYFCEACPCAEIHWQIDDDYRCTKCKHSSSEHRSVFNEEILNPITGDDDDARREALDKLHMVTDRIMLRRMKKDHTASMELPPKLIQVRNEFFSPVERDFSSSIMTNTTRQFDTYVSRGVVLNNYANIFGLIMQMRQVANHPDLILRKNAEGGQNVLICNICDEPAEDPIRSQCKHDFCRTCVKSFMEACAESEGGVDCPRCHIALSIDLSQPEIEQDLDMVKKSSIINRIRMSDWTSSTKIELLIYELYKLRSPKRTLKSIVFSQFTSMLQLVEWRLRRAGFSTVMLDGSMTPMQRKRSIQHFMENPLVEVFLVSLKAGGVALNLTEASRVFIIDPWWNPAAEWQSADRCHRIGQQRPCVITRLVIEDSVESRMVQLQEKKTNLIASTVNKDKVAIEKLSPEDLQFLFRGT